MDNYIRLCVSIKSLYGLHFDKIIVLTSWNEDILTAVFLKFLHYKGAKETSTPGN
jgi:hypothetical protein